MPRSLREIARNLVAAAIVLTFAGAAVAQDAVDHLGVPGPLTFDGQSYELAWSSQPTPDYTKQEYVPRGEDPKTYSRMVMIEVLEGAGITAAVKAQVTKLNARKGTDPLVNMDVIRNEQTGETILDFIMSERGANGEYIAEWNAYRYVPMKASDGRQGVMLFAISHRAYGNDAVKQFLGELKQMRPANIKAIAQHKLPQARTAP